MHSTGCENITKYIIEKINELNEKNEIDPEVLEAVIAFMDRDDHPAMPPVHSDGLWYQHAIKTFFGIKTDDDWNCEIAALPNWKVNTGQPIDFEGALEYGLDRLDVDLGHLHFSMKHRDVIVSVKLVLKKSPWYKTAEQPHGCWFFFETWAFGDLSGCSTAQDCAWNVNKNTQTEIFDFLKELETHECDEYCNHEKFPDNEEE